MIKVERGQVTVSGDTIELFSEISLLIEQIGQVYIEKTDKSSWNVARKFLLSGVLLSLTDSDSREDFFDDENCVHLQIAELTMQAIEKLEA